MSWGVYVREKIGNICIFFLKESENTKITLLIFARFALRCNLARRPAAKAACRRAWLHRRANRANIIELCFHSASLRNINIFLFFDDQTKERKNKLSDINMFLFFDAQNQKYRNNNTNNYVIEIIYVLAWCENNSSPWVSHLSIKRSIVRESLESWKY